MDSTAAGIRCYLCISMDPPLSVFLFYFIFVYFWRGVCSQPDMLWVAKNIAANTISKDVSCDTGDELFVFPLYVYSEGLYSFWTPPFYAAIKVKGIRRRRIVI
ncbi:hypothetical protein LI328DRAFT_98461 [Trichoderma asperelloides]|nr:hypothetical protein LI328DRAFT_98461 [Trichoderma asperelloides]